MAMSEALTRFHKVHGNTIQVVCCGAGYDNLFWRLRDKGTQLGHWFDGDEPHVVSLKFVVIDNDILQPLDNDSLIECDMGRPNLLETVLEANGFSRDLSTVFLNEYTLIDVGPSAVDLIIKFAGSLKSSGFISDAMIELNDQFGRLMVENFNKIAGSLKSGDPMYKC
jgi:O-methyltransferase involved in polyketide biosynthesis